MPAEKYWEGNKKRLDWYDTRTRSFSPAQEMAEYEQQRRAQAEATARNMVNAVDDYIYMQSHNGQTPPRQKGASVIADSEEGHVLYISHDDNDTSIDIVRKIVSEGG